MAKIFRIRTHSGESEFLHRRNFLPNEKESDIKTQIVTD